MLWVLPWASAFLLSQKHLAKDRCNGYGWNNGCGGYGFGFGGCGCSENTVVNRFELGQSQRISELESARDTDAKILEAYKALAASDQRQDEKVCTVDQIVD